MKTYLIGVTLGLLLLFLTILLKIDNTITAIASSVIGMIVALLIEIKVCKNEYRKLKMEFERASN